jgi:type IV pilus assembly protein PilY1
VGAIAQRVFVGDQDGTIWRLDVSNPDPNQWFVEPFIDAYNKTADTSASAALDRQPIVGAPALSIGRDGNVVLNFGTGDANYIGTETNPNFVYSVSELPPQAVGSSATRLIASVNWYNQFPVGGEMVTGPGAVFDGTYYFAAFSPSSTSSCTAGNGYIWGMDYMIPGDSQGNADPGLTSPKNGGAYKMTPGTASDPACTTNNQTLSNCNLVPGGAIIPGVTITSSLSCSTPSAITDPATGGPVLSASNSTPPTYSISALQGKTGSTSNAAVSQVNIAASVHSSTLIDSWAAIVE